MKGLYGCVLLIFFGSVSIAQTIQSAGSGPWNDPASWSPNTVPTNLNSSSVIINPGHTISVTDSRTIDQLTVNGILEITSGFTLTIGNGSTGSTPDATIAASGALTIHDNAVVAILNGTAFNLCQLAVSGTVNNAGSFTFAGSSSRLNFNASSIYDHKYTTLAGSIPQGSTASIVNWNVASLCRISGYTSNTSAPTGLNQEFGNFTWDTPSLNAGGAMIDLNGALSNVNGNLTINSTGDAGDVLYLSMSSSYTLNVDGNLLINGGLVGFINDAGTTMTLNLAGNFTVTGGFVVMSSDAANLDVDVNGDFDISGGDFDFIFGPGLASVTVAGDVSFEGNSVASSGASTTFSFDGGDVQNFTSTVIVAGAINFEVFTGTTLNLESGALTGAGTFLLQSGATLGVASEEGLVRGAGLGNIQVEGLRTYTSNGSIIYNGSIPQNLGDEWSEDGALSGVAVNLEIANEAGVTNNIIGSTSLVGKLILTSGALNIGNSNTLIIEGEFQGHDGLTRLGTISGFIGPTPTSNLTFAGSGTISGSLRFTEGANALRDLTINRAGTVVLGSDLTITELGTLTFSSTGNLDFDQVSGQTLTINGNIVQSGPGGLSSGTALPANLVIGGSGTLDALPFCTSCGTMQVNNVILNRTGGATYPWNSSVRITGIFDLSSGTLAHSSGLILTSTSTFRRSSGTTVTLNSPTASPFYNIEYIGNLTTSLEMPSSSTALNNLTIAGNVVLDKQIQINGDLSITSGEFNAGTFNLTMAGATFMVDGGEFAMAADRTITFARTGTTAMAGETISEIQFGNVTINSGAVVSAPNDNMNIAGTWNNGGTFTPNSGTVTFNGGDQGLDPNGQPFFNVTFAGTGSKELQGTLDVNGTLTINSTLDVGANELIRVGGSWINSGTFVASGGTVMFDGTSQVINPSGQPFYNLVLDNSGTKTLASAINIDGSLTINNGVTFDVTTSNYAINLAGHWTNDGTFLRRSGTVTFDGTTTIGGNTQTAFHGVNIAGSVTASTGTTDVSGNWVYASGSFNANGGTIRFNGSNQNINSGTQAFNNVVIAGTNNKNLLSNLDINGNLTLTSGLLDVSTSNRTIYVAGDLSANDPTRLNARSGLVVFDGTNQSITSGGISFHHAEFSSGGTKTLLDAFRANGNMDINVALAVGNNAITVGGNWDAQGGSFTTTGTTTFNGTTQSIRSNGSSFGTLVLAGVGTKSLQDALDVNGDLTVTSTLDVTTGNYGVTAAGHWNLSGGTFVSRSGLVTLDGAAQNIFQGVSNPFNNLVMAGSGTKTQQDALDINGNLSINSGSGLNAGADFGIALAGNFTANGTYAPGASTFTLDGSIIQSIGGTTAVNFHNITVDKSSGTAQIAAAHNLVNTLTMVTGTLNANGMLTLVSTATGDARIAPIPMGASITGNVIAQRYLPNGNSSRAYRYLASPVTNTFVSDWKAEFPITGTFNDPSTDAEWPGIPGPAIVSTTPSMFIYNETLGGEINDRYASYPFDGTSSTAASIQNGRGYAAFVRQSAPITLNVTGTPQQGDVVVNVTSSGASEDDGWNLVGNPYASPINWDNVTRPSGVATQIAMMDNTNNMGLGAGEYVYYTHGAPGLAIPSGYDGTIASGQAFWVRATSNTSITFQEDDKEPVSSPDFIRQAPLENVIRVNVAGNNRQDEMVIHFNEGATDGADHDYDALKLDNSYINLSSFSSDSIRMAINVLGSLTCSKEIGLAVEGVSAGAYTLNFSQFESFNNNIELRLLDNYTGTTFNIRNEGPAYEFSVSDDTNSFGKDRFKLYVTYPEVTTDLTLLTDDVCVGSPASITIQGTQEGIKYYSTLNGTTVSEEVVSTGGDVMLTIPNDKLKEGENALVLMASIAGCSAVPLDQSATVVSEKMYSITSFTNGKSCGGGQVSLTAEGAPENGSYRWYETLDSTTPIAGQVGAEFITPVLNKTQSYYVAAVNALGCEGERKEVIADVSYLEEVAIAMDELQLTSSYAEGNQWFLNGVAIEGATSQTFPVTETGLYEVEVTLNGCSTRASQEMIVLGSEFGAGSGISFYPNPVVDILQIELPESTLARGMVRSSVGKRIGDVKFTTSDGKARGEFNFEGQASGLYLIRVLQGNKIIHYKIIKK